MVSCLHQSTTPAYAQLLKTLCLVKKIYQDRAETSARINLIWNRNHKIRHAVEAIAPPPIPVEQQAIRVIREEVDHIEWALADILPR